MYKEQLMRFLFATCKKTVEREDETHARLVCVFFETWHIYCRVTRHSYQLSPHTLVCLCTNNSWRGFCLPTMKNRFGGVRNTRACVCVYFETWTLNCRVTRQLLAVHSRTCLFIRKEHLTRFLLATCEKPWRRVAIREIKQEIWGQLQVVPMLKGMTCPPSTMLVTLINIQTVEERGWRHS